MVMQLRRWLPQRPLVLVGDNSYAVLDLLHCCQSLRYQCPSVNPLPSLPDYVRTPLSMRQRQPSAGSAGPPAAERPAAASVEGPPRLKALLD